MARRKPEDLDRADAVIAAALATGATRAGAAKLAHVSESTVYERLRDPAFRARVDEARAELIQIAAGKALALVTSALEALGELLASTNDPVRLGAVKASLDYALRLRESADLEARMAALEAAAAEQVNDKGAHAWRAA